MEFATLQDTLDSGFKVIYEDEGDGQTRKVIVARMDNAQVDWVYVVLELSDDGLIMDVVALRNGRAHTP